jgi:hypothetical protein
VDRGPKTANNCDWCSNALSCERCDVSAAHATMSFFAEVLSICATRVPFACVILLRTIAEISQSWRVIAARLLCAA